MIESQLTQQNTPIVHGNGRADELHEADGSFAVVIEVGDNMLASTGRVLSLVPNRAALVQMANMAGFEHVEFATALESRGHNAQYVARRPRRDLRVLNGQVYTGNSCCRKNPHMSSLPFTRVVPRPTPSRIHVLRGPVLNGAPGHT